MTDNIELVKQSEEHRLREICITTFKHTFKEGGYTQEDFETYFKQAYNVETLQDELNNKHSFTYFYLSNNEIVGYFKLNIDDAQTEAMGESYLEIQRIYFLPQSQGGGKGKNVFDFAIKKARELYKTKIWLGVWEYNEKALNFYKKQGLRITGSHEFHTGNVVDTDLIMEKNI
ncbi:MULTISPECIES: GNAT family N-acetyltransferase [unclassified Staphylococcus]|uniref:GNAT family N-acetyltransferase n=1 Tax=unclassified Staphylococcus TaxID=91994 RepID=UPI001AEC6AB6|nr:MULTISPECIES: GNAT family N-acetyltransferase [unclassified Staphylococcus]